MDEMQFIPSPSGKAKCGEVGGKADGQKGIKYSAIAAVRGDSAGPPPSLYRPIMTLALHYPGTT